MHTERSLILDIITKQIPGTDGRKLGESLEESLGLCPLPNSRCADQNNPGSFSKLAVHHGSHDCVLRGKSKNSCGDGILCSIPYARCFLCIVRLGQCRLGDGASAWEADVNPATNWCVLKIYP